MYFASHIGKIYVPNNDIHGYFTNTYLLSIQDLEDRYEI